MSKLKITVETAEAILEDAEFSNPPEFVDGFKYVETVDVGSGRWESYHNVIVEQELTGKYFSFEYSLGLTESQYGAGKFSGQQEITFAEVKKVEVISHKWDKVKAISNSW